MEQVEVFVPLCMIELRNGASQPETIFFASMLILHLVANWELQNQLLVINSILEIDKLRPRMFKLESLSSQDTQTLVLLVMASLMFSLRFKELLLPRHFLKSFIEYAPERFGKIVILVPLRLMEVDSQRLELKQKLVLKKQQFFTKQVHVVTQLIVFIFFQW